MTLQNLAGTELMYKTVFQPSRTEGGGGRRRRRSLQEEAKIRLRIILAKKTSLKSLCYCPYEELRRRLTEEEEEGKKEEEKEERKKEEKKTRRLQQVLIA